MINFGDFIQTSMYFFQASMCYWLSEICWNLQKKLSTDFVGCERLVDLLFAFSIVFDEKFEELVGYGENSAI